MKSCLLALSVQGMVANALLATISLSGGVAQVGGDGVVEVVAPGGTCGAEMATGGVDGCWGGAWVDGVACAVGVEMESRCLNVQFGGKGGEGGGAHALRMPGVGFVVRCFVQWER